MTLNPDTRVSVHCYEGDAWRVKAALHIYLAHQCPLTILSPVDSRAIIEGPNITCRFAGTRNGTVIPSGRGPLSVGRGTWERQRDQMAELLKFPETHFFMNDADSLCLSPKLPNYLYDEPNIVWSNLVYDEIPQQQRGYPRNFPRIALQPPYFLSRRSITAMLDVSETTMAHFNPVMPFIDFYMIRAAYDAGLVWKAFPDGRSSAVSTRRTLFEHLQVAVRHQGVIFVHDMKSPIFWDPLLKAHKQFLDDYRGPEDFRPNDNVDTTHDVRIVGNERQRDYEKSLWLTPQPAQIRQRHPSIKRPPGVRA